MEPKFSGSGSRTKTYTYNAKTIDEAKELLEVGFEYVTDMGDIKLFRKRK